MSGFLIGQLILWLIVAIIAIVIIVYIVNWLYHRSSKEVSFVRTGFLGERVVINGGAFVLPFIHDYTPVNMNVLPMGITRARQDAVITRDRMRVDIEADFYVRVQATREAVAIAAATLGRRTLEPEQLHALLSGKFVSAIRSVAAEMTMEQMLGSRPLPPKRWPRTDSSWSPSRSPTSTRPISNFSTRRTASMPRVSPG
jgi:uncharacterized membrane protein YqiK